MEDPLQTIPPQSPPPDNLPADSSHQSGRHRIGLILKVILVSVSVLVITGIGYIIFVAGTVSDHCSDTVPHQVHQEEASQAAYYGKLTIVTGQATHATANGNTDCIDGGPNSVSTSGDIAASGTYASARQDVDTNLARVGYTQRGSIQPQNNNQATADGREAMNGLRVIYKNSDNDYIDVTYHFITIYPFICPNGAKICNYPDLQAVQDAPISGISFDNLAPAYEILPADRQATGN